MAAPYEQTLYQRSGGFSHYSSKEQRSFAQKRQLLQMQDQKATKQPLQVLWIAHEVVSPITDIISYTSASSDQNLTQQQIAEMNVKLNAFMAFMIENQPEQDAPIDEDSGPEEGEIGDSLDYFFFLLLTNQKYRDQQLIPS